MMDHANIDELITWAIANPRRGGRPASGAMVRAEWGCTDRTSRDVARLAMDVYHGEVDQMQAVASAGAEGKATPSVAKLFEIVRTNLSSGMPDVDVILDEYVKWQGLMQSMNPTAHEVVVSVAASHPILLVGMADIHFGNINVLTERFLEDMREIQTRPYVKTILAGDLGEGGMLPSMMDLVLDQLVPPKAQRQILWQLFERIVPNCLAVITGQHDHWTQKKGQFDWLEWFCSEKGLHYMGWGGCIKLTVGEQEYKIVARHKARFNSSMNPTHSVKQLMRLGEYGFADIGLVADRHTYAYEVVELGGRPTALMRPGSYKPTDAFCQEHGYPASRPFMPGLLLWPDRRLFKGSHDYRQLLPEVDAMAAGRLDWEAYPRPVAGVDHTAF